MVGIVVGSVAGLVTALGTVTMAEGLLAWERLAPTRLGSVLPHSGSFGTGLSGPPIRLGIMGDSLAVGYGVDDPEDTPGVILATGLVRTSGRPVELTNVAQVGAESTALIGQLAHLREVTTPDAVVIIIGANDVMHLKRLIDALWPLSEVVRELRRDGAQVVAATCPDLGAVHSFSQPLRLIAHWASRLCATGQAIVALRAGGRTVSLADTLGSLFREDPQDMFSARDHLHPSDLGYETAAAVILPSLCASVGCHGLGDIRIPHRVYRKGSHHPLAWWAFRASQRVGARLTAYESATAGEPLPHH